MQRSAAIVFALFFMLASGSAYSIIATSTAPPIEVTTDITLNANESITVEGTTYTVENIHPGINATIRWINQSARYTTTFENNSTVSAANVVWQEQANRRTTLIRNGSTITYNGTSYDVQIASTNPPQVAYLNSTTSNDSRSLDTGSSIFYHGNQTTVVSIASESVTLAWGDPYRVRIENVSEPEAFELVEDINITRHLRMDTNVEDSVLTGTDGMRYIRYGNGSTKPLTEYLPEPETTRFEVGNSLGYRGNDSTIVEISPTEVRIEWVAPKNNSPQLQPGENITIDGKTYMIHLPSDDAVLVLTQDFQGYKESQERIAYYHERRSGLWGVTILSSLAAILLLGLSYLPPRY